MRSHFARPGSSEMPLVSRYAPASILFRQNVLPVKRRKLFPPPLQRPRSRVAQKNTSKQIGQNGAESTALNGHHPSSATPTQQLAILQSRRSSQATSFNCSSRSGSKRRR